MEKAVIKIELADHLWEDDRGWGVNLLHAAGLNTMPVGDLHIVSLKPGKIRGNHYHQTSTEWLLFFGGQAKLLWREAEAQPIHEVEIFEAGPTLYKIPPKVEHAAVNTGGHDIYLSAISDREDRGTVTSVNLIVSREH